MPEGPAAEPDPLSQRVQIPNAEAVRAQNP